MGGPVGGGALQLLDHRPHPDSTVRLWDLASFMTRLDRLQIMGLSPNIVFNTLLAIVMCTALPYKNRDPPQKGQLLGVVERKLQ